MKKIVVLAVMICVAALAQDKQRGGQSRGGGHPEVGGGHIPDRGPAPAKASKAARGSSVQGQQQPNAY